MSQVLASLITDLTISFFANGRVYHVQSDHPSYAEVRRRLGSGDKEAEPLIELADIKVVLQKAGLEFDEHNELTYGGKGLHHMWAEKIMKFRAEGLDFQPIFNALESLLRNPTQYAIERFPIFAERNQFGFLADGRVGAFKYVDANFRDCYSGCFDNSPGQIVAMDRDDCNDDPNETCSNGLHVGALEYVRKWGGSDSNKRVMFVAFWPEDVVAVPTDYNGTKMRVCRYEVLQEVEKGFLDEFLGRNTTIIETPEEKRKRERDATYSNAYHQGCDLYDEDEYVNSLQEMISTRKALVERGDKDELAGFDAGWKDAAAGSDFDDQRPDDVVETKTEAEVSAEWGKAYDTGYNHGKYRSGFWGNSLTGEEHLGYSVGYDDGYADKPHRYKN